MWWQSLLWIICVWHAQRCMNAPLTPDPKLFIVAARFSFMWDCGFVFNFCNDSSEKWVIVPSAHIVEEFPLSLVLRSCAIVKPGRAAIISARDGETRDDHLYSLYSLTRLWRIWGVDHKHSRIHAELRRPGTIDKKHLCRCLISLTISGSVYFRSLTHC